MGKHSGSKQNAAVAIKYAALCVLILAVILISLSAGKNAAVPVFEAAASPPPSLQPAQSISPSPSPAASEAIAEAIKDEKALLALDEINAAYSGHGEFTIEGMRPQDYDKAMSIEWRAVDTPGEPEELSVDLSELMDYGDIEKYIMNLGGYDGVEVSVVGKSEQDRNIYMVKLCFGGDAEDKPLIMLTGGVHAREFAGPEYLMKLLNDIVIKAQSDEYTRLLLENVTIAAVPLVNPDGRELIIEGGDPDRKSNANGVDLNRAMPSLSAGQLGAGYKLNSDFSTEPGIAFFPGYNLGTESETQAMMKWMNVYVPKAEAYIDLHQQGGITFYNKGYISSKSDGLSKQFAQQINELLENGYPLSSEAGSYGLSGVGGTFTDYAKSVSEGFVYSYSLGRMVLDANGKELPLIVFRDIDNCIKYYKSLNPGFKSISIEIGRNRKYLGSSDRALRYREKEFYDYNWPKFLTGVIETLLGKEKTASLQKAAGQ